MTDKLKKIISVFLLISMILSSAAFASCAKDNNETNSGENNANATIESDPEETVISEEEERAKYDPTIEAVDMQGYIFTMGTRDDSTHNFPFHTRDLYAESLNADIINDEVYNRNKKIEDKYNCKIVMKSYPESDEKTAINVVSKNAAAGDYSFDILLAHMIHTTANAVKGYYYNIKGFPHIDLNKPYWNKGATQGLSVGENLFVGLSDMSFSTNENAYCMFFNKKLAMEYNVENPYQLVAENKWTMDMFNELIKTSTSDLDGNGKMDKNDQYGYVNSNSLNFLWAGGSHVTAKDESNVPYMDLLTERTIDVFNKAFEITNNPYTFKDREWFNQDSIDIFSNGRGLFYSSQLCRVNDLRNTDFDFGIIPYPKYDSDQKEYYSYVDGHASMMAIPINLPNENYTGILLEELAYESYKSILPKYYDVVLNVKMVRDEESVDMLKIIFDSKTFDFGYAYGDWDTSFLFLDCIHKEDTAFVSKYEKRAKTAEKALDKVLAEYGKLEG